MKTIGAHSRKIITAGIIIFLAAAVGIGIYLTAPSKMISIDVNPSIEIHTNRLGYVVSVDPVNDDAVKLMEGYQLVDKNLETVIANIVDRMIFNGYLVSADSNQILISSNNDVTSKKLLEKVNQVLTSYLQAKQLEVAVLDQEIDITSKDIETAHDNKVSVGKMAIINRLTEATSEVTTEELADDSIKQLTALAVSKGVSLDNQITNFNEAKASQNTLVDAVSSATTTEPKSTPSSSDGTNADSNIIVIGINSENDDDSNYEEEDDEDSDYEEDDEDSDYEEDDEDSDYEEDDEDSDYKDDEEDDKDEERSKSEGKKRREDAFSEDRDEDSRYEDSEDKDRYEDDSNHEDLDNDEAYDASNDSDEASFEEAEEQEWDKEDTNSSEDSNYQEEDDEEENDEEDNKYSNSDREDDEDRDWEDGDDVED